MTMLNSKAEALVDLILRCAESETLKKAIFSKPSDKEIKKSVLSLKKIAGKNVLQLEIFTADNKAKHRNIAPDDRDALSAEVEGYSQINLYSTLGECEYKVSKSGNCALIGGDKLKRALDGASDVGFSAIKRIEPTANNKRKNYILNGDEPFLKLLEVSDKNGRVYDKKQAKFRQINRFLELVRDVESELPDGDLRICDLCCGKSYLSFAVYHYFAVIKGRRVKMTGVDLKRDVIEYCSDVAEKLGFDGLEFLCGDVSLYDTDDRVDMVVSLHACDIATDIVINKAIEWDAKVILSTPCCHHEMNRLLNCERLSFIADYSMLRQKLCDAATDALRLKKMEANGYDTAALELIDPEETPKNVMLRGIKKNNFDKKSDKARALYAEYTEIYRFLTGKDPVR
ncbi:MAG: SAM-dependent methyltransferase [Clostridia bacterium]|nr:SAM-dependent methyltransferase [Clostridia bacterium]